MQKWLKFQSQSKILEKKVLFIIFSIGIISISSQVYAQEDLGLLIEQQEIIFEVGKHSDVHVKHVIETGAWNSDRPRIIEILPGMHSNLKVTDEDGYRLNFSYDKETFEESKFIILNQKLGNYDLITEYDLDNFMELEEGLWKKEFRSSQDIMIMFEEEIKLIFANSRPIDVIDANGINCIGCGLTLEYFHDKKISTKEISFSQGKFDIELLSNGEILEIEFIEGGAQLLNFNVKDKDQLYVLKIPLENFLNPYEVYFTKNDDKELDQRDKIRNTEFGQDETHVKISFRTSTEGTISIVGATPEEHQKRLERIKEVKSREVESQKIEEEKKGIALPIPGTKASSELAVEFGQANDEEKADDLSFSKELERTQTTNSEDQVMIIVAVIAVIVGVIIVGIIFKLKKN
jgi:hypothetical protein